jgi:hypothetical protein
MTKQEIAAVERAVLEKIRDYEGHGDYGNHAAYGDAAALRGKLEAWKAGLKGEIPADFLRLVKK